MLLIFVFYLTNIFFGDIVYRCGSAYIRHKYCRDTMNEVCFVQLPIINIIGSSLLSFAVKESKTKKAVLLVFFF